MSNFNNDNFEKLLKERSDEFKMYPTKRVWYSIYNNIHPGRKWPSIATCITLISTLLLIGFLNSNNHSENFNVKNPSSPTFAAVSNKTISSLLNYNSANPIASNSLFTLSPDNSSVQNLSNATSFLNYQNISDVDNEHTNTSIPLILSSITPTFKNTKTKTANTNLINLQNNNLNTTPYSSTRIIESGNIYSEINNNDLPSPLKIITNAIVFQKEENLIAESQKIIEHPFVENFKLTTLPATKNIKELTLTSEDKNVNKTSIEKHIIKNKEIHILSDVEKAWVESYALYNRPEPKKWLGKLGWQIYISPSVVYRTLKNALPNEQNINNSIVQKPALGLEIGGGIISSVFKNVKLKTGLQLNFTRYNSEAYENSHPVATRITIRSEMGQTYQESRSTPYSNNGGISPIKLHNETFQISIPMGMDVAILNFDNLQWSMGATIQPSYIIGGKSYLISSDKRNYIRENSLLNRWNLDAGFETFISYKTNGFTVQFGPQFRKQLFTTNNKNYFIQEHLNNYGFKFGISKLIK